jgi:hypothetical protein
MGFDEVLDVENVYDENVGHHVSRFLMQFDLEGSGISDSVLTSAEYFLNLKITESSELLHKSFLQIFPVSSRWTEGPGRRYDVNTLYKGVTWNVRHDASTPWEEPGGDIIRYIENEHGLTEELVCEYEFGRRTSDVSVNITKIVEKWISGEIENNGILVKFKDETILSEGRVSFFSKDTNTIYSPYIRIAYNDYYFNPCECLSTETLSCDQTESDDITDIDTIISGSLISGSLISGSILSGSLISGSLISGSMLSGSLISGSMLSGSLISGSTYIDPVEPDVDCLSVLNRTTTHTPPNINHISSEDVNVNIKNIRQEYSVAEDIRMRVGVRELYPKKTFSQKSDYLLNNYVDYPMYYSVRDADTHEVRIPWDAYSRINCDALGHYFDIDFGCLSVGRIYEFMIRVESPNQTKVVTIKTKFMVGK